jgi:glycosyltransferase involved in cell wall biosynthesis
MATDIVSPAPPDPSRSDAAAGPRVAVIVPVHDAADTLAVQLEALASQTFSEPWELILADNGSRDRSLDVAHGFADRLPLRIVDASEMRGAGHARNVGVTASRAPLLAFVDADDEVAPGWLAAVVAALGRYPAVASRFDKARLNPPELSSTRKLAQELGLAAHNYAAFLPHAGGCGLAVRRHVHEEIGGFDVRLRRLEDTDYCWRLQLAGHALHFEGDALVHIRFRTSRRASLWQAFAYGRYDGWLYQRYRLRGMTPVPLRRDLGRILRLVGALPFKRDRASRARTLRGLVNRLGIVVGRLTHPWVRD